MSANIRITGLLKGIVVNTEDPAGLNAVQVRVPALHGLVDPTCYGPLNKNTARTQLWVDDSRLPWAEVCFPFGSTQLPEVNQVVWVTFQNGNSSHPVIMGWAGYEYTTEEESYDAIVF